jgi:UDP-N-acetylglucosamine diphosphorylase / glucose-1-phosphate thymidylyltransferase / UDP-N-acetylgalactosamine diphosphorylase / glucosamine-1-phosphate N-acetyltransferase / galactosamine-1-phosphate N-acetyltransferase
MNYILFEDQQKNNLAPFTINHASFEVRCGAFTNIERVKGLMNEGDKLYLIVHAEFCLIIRERYPEFIVNPDILPVGLYLNGATLWDSKTLDKINLGKNYSRDGVLISMSLDDEIPLSEFPEKLQSSIQVTLDIPARHFNYLWDTISFQHDVLTEDAEAFMSNRGGEIHQSVIYDTVENVFIHDAAKISAGVILDASKGPIIIDENVMIDIGALIQGPVYIGKNSRINPGAKLRGNISIGTTCKVGGEVEDVIIHAYSNKQHDGFLGHSYIGEWVNLGANTNNSDLKNNYSNIRVNLNKDLEINTMKQFLGVLIGDYSKSGISTMFNSGTVVGLGANIFGSDFQPKFIESFSWGGGEEKTELDKFIETSERVKSRRNLELSSIEKKFLKNLYSPTI